MHDFHGTTAKHVGWSNDQRITDVGTPLQRFLPTSSRAVGWLLESQICNEFLKPFAVFSKVDRIRRCANDGCTRRFECAREFQRRLAAVLHDNALGLFVVDDLHDIFERQRFEIKPVGGVVIGRYGFRIAIDHDGLEARFLERQCRVNAAIVEFDALPDSVRAATEDHDLGFARRLRLALFVVGRIQVGRCRSKLRGTRIDTLVNRSNIQVQTLLAHRALVEFENFRDPSIRESLALDRTHPASIECGQAGLANLAFDGDQVGNLHQEPGVDAGQLGHIVIRVSIAHRVCDIQQAISSGHAKLLP